MAKITGINKRLEMLLNKADIQETLKPGSAIKILPLEKELSRLAYLSGLLCKLRKDSRASSKGPVPEKALRRAQKVEPLSQTGRESVDMICGLVTHGTFKP